MNTDISLTTSQAAAVLEMDLGTLRFWDKLHCLPINERGPGQWRKFNFEELIRVAVLERMVRFGIPVCLAADSLAEAIHPLTSADFLKAPNSSIGIALFRGNRKTLAIKYMSGPLPESLFASPCWATRRAWAMELIEGEDTPVFQGTVETLASPEPEAVSIISLNRIIERITDRLQGLHLNPKQAEETARSTHEEDK